MCWQQVYSTQKSSWKHIVIRFIPVTPDIVTKSADIIFVYLRRDNMMRIPVGGLPHAEARGAITARVIGNI